jgi:hypothetical protein
MLCRDIEFQEFMGCGNESATATALCAACGIESRTELNGNEEAQMAFDALVLSFKTRSRDDPF